MRISGLPNGYGKTWRLLQKDSRSLEVSSAGIPLPEWQEWAQLPAWSSEKILSNEGPGFEHPVISRVPVDERPRAGDPLTNLDDEMKQCLLRLLSQTPNLDFEGVSQNTIQQEAFRKKCKHTSAEEVDAATMFTLVDRQGRPTYLSPFVVVLRLQAVLLRQTP